MDASIWQAAVIRRVVESLIVIACVAVLRDAQGQSDSFAFGRLEQLFALSPSLSFKTVRDVARLPSEVQAMLRASVAATTIEERGDPWDSRDVAAEGTTRAQHVLSLTSSNASAVVFQVAGPNGISTSLLLSHSELKSYCVLSYPWNEFPWEISSVTLQSSGWDQVFAGRSMTCRKAVE